MDFKELEKNLDQPTDYQKKKIVNLVNEFKSKKTLRKKENLELGKIA